jgi:hypothetical protein
MSTLRQFNTPISLSSAALSATHNSNTVANIFTTGGNVGIGTTAPTTTLSVQGTNVSTSIITDGENKNATLFLGTPFLGDPNNGLKTALIAQGKNNYSQARLHFCLDNSNINNTASYASISNSRMMIDSNGYVGIGTTSPVSTLDVRGDVWAANGIRLVSTTSPSINYIQSGIALVGGSVADLRIGPVGSQNPCMTVRTNGNVGISTTAPTYTLDVDGTLETYNSNGLMLFASSGNLGIGNTAPSFKLDVTSNARFTGKVHIGSNSTVGSLVGSTSGSGLNIYYGNLDNTPWQISSNSGIFTINQYGSSNIFSINTVGNVGISTTAPSYTLDVNGTLEASNSNGLMLFASSGNVFIGSTNTTNSAFGNGNLMLYGTNNSNNGIAINGVGNSTLQFFNSGALKGAVVSVATAGNWSTDSRVGDMVIRCASNQSILFNSNGGSGVSTMIISGGNVGIGTTSPGEALEIRGNLRVGNSTSGNYISFYGTNGDTPGGWNHTYIGERIYNPTEQSELLLFKGNDSTTGGGADRIRLLAAEHKIDIYTSTLNGTFEGVGTSGTNIMTINSSGTLVTGSITKTVYNSGEVIQSKCYSSAIGTSFTTSISGAYPVVVSTLSFTPLSSSSFIMVSVDCTYSVPGSGPDTFQSGITIAGTTVITKSQTWYASGTDISTTMRNNNNSLFPLMGIAPNTSTTAKTIQVLAGRGTSDDTMTLSNINIEIREIKQ